MVKATDRLPAVGHWAWSTFGGSACPGKGPETNRRGCGYLRTVSSGCHVRAAVSCASSSSCRAWFGSILVLAATRRTGRGIDGLKCCARCRCRCRERWRGFGVRLRSLPGDLRLGLGLELGLGVWSKRLGAGAADGRSSSLRFRLRLRSRLQVFSWGMAPCSGKTDDSGAAGRAPVCPRPRPRPCPCPCTCPCPCPPVVATETLAVAAAPLWPSPPGPASGPLLAPPGPQPCPA